MLSYNDVTYGRPRESAAMAADTDAPATARYSAWLAERGVHVDGLQLHTFEREGRYGQIALGALLRTPLSNPQAYRALPSRTSAACR